MNNKQKGIVLYILVVTILAIWALVLLQKWVNLQEINSVVVCEEANVDSSFCVTWYKAEFNRVFPN